MEDCENAEPEVTDLFSGKNITNLFKGLKTKDDKSRCETAEESSKFGCDVYDFTYPRRGVAIIINNKNFINSAHTRHNSEIDVIRLTKMFTCYNFDVIIYNDLTADEIVATLKMVAALPDHAKADCFACAICSHGDQVCLTGERTASDAIMGVRGDLVLTKVLLEIYTDEKCPGLRGKPRLFFIQACRGELLDDGQTVYVSKLKPATALDKYPTPNSATALDKYPTPNSATALDKYPTPNSTDTRSSEWNSGNDCNPNPLCAPIFPHFLVMYASPPGHSAWRRNDGTWFIRCLTDTLLSTCCERVSLTKVLTLVSGQVAKIRSQTGKKQVPCVVSKLTRDVFLTPKSLT